MELKVNFDNPSVSDGGVFQGFGTSLCWWANRVGYSPALTEKCARLFFSPDGINLNIMRYNIGGGDNPSHRHIKRTDSIIPGWATLNEDTGTLSYDYNADKNQLNVLSACYKSANNPIVELFSNSPPYFMTESGCSSGHFDAKKDNLKRDCYEEFSQYLAHVTEYINNTLKIKVTSLSPMNEPNTSYWEYKSPKQEGCHFDKGESQNKILCLCHKALEEKELRDIEIVASDETSTDKAIESILHYSAETKSFLKRINAHTYGTDKAEKLQPLCKKEGYNLWMSETDWGDTCGKNAGQMGAGLWLGEKIIKDINTLSPSAWILWQVIDYHKSKDGYCGNVDSGIPDKEKGFWGLAFADHDAEEIILTQKYYCMGQFSKFIGFADTIYHIDKNVLCAHNGKETKIVTVNSKKETEPIKISLKNTQKSYSNVKAYRTSGTVEDGECIQLITNEAIDNNCYQTYLKPNSVTTFIFE